MIGLDAVRLDGSAELAEVGPPVAAYKLALDWDGAPLLCICHPLSSQPLLPAVPIHQSTTLPTPSDELDLLPGIAPSPTGAAEDEKTEDRESDPPPRVWRVVPRAQDPSGPAWVVGTLVHAALRRWRFPDAPDFEPFLYPYALDAGLTDPTEILNAMAAARRLLERFRAHSLWAEIDGAERHPELPYTLDGERGIVDLLYQAGGRWTVAEFKTDRLADAEAVQRQIGAANYDAQVMRYVGAVKRLLGERPRALLVFLNMGGGIQVIEC